MKRKHILFVAGLLMSLLTILSCEKKPTGSQTEWEAAMPSAQTPATDQVIAFTGGNQAINLSWAGKATNAVKWYVFFGDTDQPDLVASDITTNSYTAHVTSGGTYYWQVATIDANNVESWSPVWSFQVNSNPAIPTLTAPADAATAVSKTVALKWTATDPEEDDLTYDVYLGTTATPGVAATGVTAATYSPTLAYNTTYYWKVVAHDPYGGVSTSVIRSFKTDVQQPDFTVFNGISSEVAASPLSTAAHDVQVQRIGTSNVIALTIPLADNMVAAGWGTVYTGSHTIYVTYDPVTSIITSTKQLWMDSFIDPVEMGPMSLQVAAGSTIDGFTKKLKIKWIVSGNAYWGGDYTTGVVTYTMK